MGHHRDEQGRFQSDKHDIPPDRVRINIEHPHNWPGLLLIAEAYMDIDVEFASDLRERILELAKGKGATIHYLHVPFVAMPVGVDD